MLGLVKKLSSSFKLSEVAATLGDVSFLFRALEGQSRISITVRIFAAAEETFSL